MQDVVVAHSLGAEIDELMSAISRDSNRDIARHYAVIHEIGKPAIEQLAGILNKANWGEIEHPHKLKVLGTLMNLIHDIDETQSARISDQIRQNGCHPAIAQRLKSICGYFKADFRVYESRGISVYESRRIETINDIPSLLARWLANVPAADLAGINRMHVIPFEQSRGYAGLYLPHFSVITLVWDEMAPGSDWQSRAWLNRLGSWISLHKIEQTLYHEIGHHVHRHSGGQDPDKEREANRYAAPLYLRSHPWLWAVAGPMWLYNRCRRLAHQFDSPRF